MGISERKNVLRNKNTSLRYIRMALKIKRRYFMNNINKLAHSIWECKYHLVWYPKYRFRILVGEVGKSVKEIIQELCSWKKLEIIEGSI
jgi:hypothetical protein